MGRTKGEDVQGEPAFDPFCLMDEQPESWRSFPVIAREIRPAEEVAAGRWQEAHEQYDTEAACCGFPSFHTDSDRYGGVPRCANCRDCIEIGNETIPSLSESSSDTE